MMLRDMHLHSSFSDGADSIEDMVRCALSLGLERICFTDHVWKSSDWTDAYFREIERCKALYGEKIEVSPGVEAKLLDCEGSVDVSERLLASGVRIVAAMHRIPCGGGVFIRASEIDRDTGLARERWLAALRGVCRNPRIICLAHPFSLLGHLGVTRDDENWWSTVAGIVGQGAYDIEFNVKYDNTVVPPWFWQQFWGRVVPASDSHSVQELRARSDELSRVSTSIGE